MNSIAPPIHTAIKRYADGEISASQAADLLGPDASVHDVIVGLRAAGLAPPRSPRSIELAEMAKARDLLARHRAG